MAGTQATVWSVLLGVGLVIASVVLVPGPVAATESDCADVVIVWARGSGQDTVTLSNSNNAEGSAFFSGVAMRLPDEIDEILRYELGRDNHAHGIEHRYPAHEVSKREAFDAWSGRFTPGWPESLLEDGGYVDSVNVGAKELTAFIVQRIAKCPLELFVIGGYSQGAHVIGAALTDPVDGVPRWARDRIAFVALFGDPTLSLPKGSEAYVHVVKGPFGLWSRSELRPAACRGLAGDLEVYRRGNTPCNAVHGILAVSENRPVYLPHDMISGAFGSPETTRAGSWCLRDDPICTNTAEQFLRHAQSISFKRSKGWPGFQLSSNGYMGSHDDYANAERGRDGHTSWIKRGAAEAATLTALIWWADSWPMPSSRELPSGHETRAGP